MSALYDADILAWSEQQAALLRDLASVRRNAATPDWDNIIEEIESVGRSQLSAVRSLLAQALLHMLKAQAWPHSPASPGWRAEAIRFRQDAAEAFAPSMRQKLDVADLRPRAARPARADRRSAAAAGAGRVPGDARCLAGAAVTVRALTIACVLLLGACSLVSPKPPAVAVRKTPPEHAQAAKPPPDWFHRQLAAAAEAKRTHQPASDTAGAQKAYDDVMQAACTHLAVSGSDQYPARCDAVLRHTAPPEPQGCEGTEPDAVALRACND